MEEGNGGREGEGEGKEGEGGRQQTKLSCQIG